MSVGHLPTRYPPPNPRRAPTHSRNRALFSFCSASGSLKSTAYASPPLPTPEGPAEFSPIPSSNGKDILGTDGFTFAQNDRLNDGSIHWERMFRRSKICPCTARTNAARDCGWEPARIV